MNIQTLYNIVEKLIKPKYPWIVDFRWIVFRNTAESDGNIYYKLIIKVDDSVSGFLKVMYQLDISQEMKSIFQMLGPEPDERFWTVSFDW